MANSLNASYLRGIKLAALHGLAGVHHQVSLHNLDGINIQWTRGWAADHLSHRGEDRTVAWAVELAFVFAPGHRTAQVGAFLPQGQVTAIFQARDVEPALLHVVDGAGLEFIHTPGYYAAAKSARLDARHKIAEKR